MREEIRIAGENGNKYIDVIKPVLTEMAGTGLIIPGRRYK